MQLLVYGILVSMVYVWCLFIEVLLFVTEVIKQMVHQIAEVMTFDFLLNLVDVVYFFCDVLNFIGELHDG